MTKRTRQYLGILAAIAAYYLVHEGAHLLQKFAPVPVKFSVPYFITLPSHF